MRIQDLADLHDGVVRIAVLVRLVQMLDHLFQVLAHLLQLRVQVVRHQIRLLTFRIQLLRLAHLLLQRFQAFVQFRVLRRNVLQLLLKGLLLDLDLLEGVVQGDNLIAVLDEHPIPRIDLRRLVCKVLLLLLQLQRPLVDVLLQLAEVQLTARRLCSRSRTLCRSVNQWMGGW